MVVRLLLAQPLLGILRVAEDEDIEKLFSLRRGDIARHRLDRGRYKGGVLTINREQKGRLGARQGRGQGDCISDPTGHHPDETNHGGRRTDSHPGKAYRAEDQEYELQYGWRLN